MKLSKSLVRDLITLIEGGQVPYSSFNNDMREVLHKERMIIIKTNGSFRKIYTACPSSLKEFLANNFDGYRNLYKLRSLLNEHSGLRADLAEYSGNSKTKNVKTYLSFPINTVTPLRTHLNCKGLVIDPAVGTFLYITDWRHFIIPEDVIVIGIENIENFRHVRNYKEFFKRYVENIQ